MQNHAEILRTCWFYTYGLPGVPSVAETVSTFSSAQKAELRLILGRVQEGMWNLTNGPYKTREELFTRALSLFEKKV